MAIESVQTGACALDNAGGAYAKSFGLLPNETPYAGFIAPDIKSLDKRDMLNEKLQVGLKALGTQSGGAGTAGYALIPVYLDPQIVDRSRKFTPLTEIIPRVTQQGTEVAYNYLSAKGGAVALGEDGALPDSDNTYARATASVKYLYAVGRVTGPAMAATPSAMLMGFQPPSGAVGAFADAAAPNAMQREVLVAARALKELEELLIIRGNKSTSVQSSNPNGTEFDGFVTLIGTTNKQDAASAALTFDMIDAAIEAAFNYGGRPNIAVASANAYRQLQSLLTAKIGYLQATSQVFWGFSAITLHTMVGDVPVIPSMFLLNTTNNKSIWFLDLSVVELRVLQDMTFERLAKTNDSEKFMLKMYECLIVRAPSFCSSIQAIA